MWKGHSNKFVKLTGLALLSLYSQFVFKYKNITIIIIILDIITL